MLQLQVLWVEPKPAGLLVSHLMYCATKLHPVLNAGVTLAVRCTQWLLIGFVAVIATAPLGACTRSDSLDLAAQEPFLLPVVAQVYEAGTPIDDLAFINVGGVLTDCTVKTDGGLPGGLGLRLTEDRRSCMLRGTPEFAQEATEYTITAVGVLGSFDLPLAIAVIAAGSATSHCAQNSPTSMRSATYLVTFSAAWSQANNGAPLPPDAHFSPLIGAGHNPLYTMWEPGGTASNSIESMAETGSTSALTVEISAHIAVGNVGAVVAGGQTQGAAGTITATLMTTCEHGLVSVVSMVAPSPDWFVGVHGISLLDQFGNWRAMAEYPLYVYDAGTDSGTVYTSANADITPHIPIVRLTGNATIGLSADLNQDQIGRMIFRHIQP